VSRASGEASLIVTALGPHDHPSAVRAAVAEAEAFRPGLAFTVLPGTGYAPPWGAEEVITILVVDEPERTRFFARRLARAFEQDAVLVHDLGGRRERQRAATP
jgi:hypothetical protein